MKNKAAVKLKDSAAMFAALGDETRLQIIRSLCEQGPQSISKLAEGKKITRQAITKHLRTLQASGLAQSRQDGRETIWDFNKKRLQIAREFLDLVSHQWDERLERLKMLVEEADH